MVETPKVAVLFGFGINCDRETAAVFDIAGGKSERVHVNRFVNGERDLSEFHILAVPGGFSFGKPGTLPEGKAVYSMKKNGL